MKQLQSSNHTVWECKYHIVWIPKYRKKILYGKLICFENWLQHTGGALMCESCAYVVADSAQV